MVRSYKSPPSTVQTFATPFGCDALKKSGFHAAGALTSPRPETEAHDLAESGFWRPPGNCPLVQVALQCVTPALTRRSPGPSPGKFRRFARSDRGGATRGRGNP